MTNIEKANAVLAKINSYNNLGEGRELFLAPGKEEDCAIVKINKELAAELQSLNFKRNRNMRPERIAGYAKEMKEGRWGLSTDAIGIDDEGNLINAQHRTGGVVMSDTEQKFLIVVGIPHDAVMYIDGGIRRNVSDQLKIANEDPLYGNKGSASLVKAINYTKLGGERRIDSSYDIEKMITEYYWLCKYFVSHRGHKKMSNALVYTSLFAAVGLGEIDFDDMEAFLRCINDNDVEQNSAEKKYKYKAALDFMKWYDNDRNSADYDTKSKTDILVRKAEEAIWCFTKNVKYKRGEGTIFAATELDMQMANSIIERDYSKRIVKVA